MNQEKNKRIEGDSKINIRNQFSMSHISPVVNLTWHNRGHDNHKDMKLLRDCQWQPMHQAGLNCVVKEMNTRAKQISQEKCPHISAGSVMHIIQYLPVNSKKTSQ